VHRDVDRIKGKEAIGARGARAGADGGSRPDGWQGATTWSTTPRSACRGRRSASGRDAAGA